MQVIGWIFYELRQIKCTHFFHMIIDMYLIRQHRIKDADSKRGKYWIIILYYGSHKVSWHLIFDQFSELIADLDNECKSDKRMISYLLNNWIFWRLRHTKVPISYVVFLFRMNLWSVEHFLNIFVIIFGWVCCCFAIAPTQKWWQKWPRNV